MSTRRVGVLVSGSGSNLQALIDAASKPGYPADIVCVLSNRAGVKALDRAAQANIPAEVVHHKDYDSREAFDAALTQRLESRGVDLVANAGFMRIHSPGFVKHWYNRQLNIHPSLLPLFPGLNTHARALKAGVKLHGCTVHMVRAEVDAGPILGQAAVPVLPGDDAASLAARVLQVEHRLYPTCLAAFAGGEMRVVDDRVITTSTMATAQQTLINPAPQS